MTGIIEQESRVVTKEPDGSYKMVWHQVQKYTEEQVANMLKQWEAELAERQKWLDNFEGRKTEAEKMLETQMEVGKKKMEQDIAFINDGIKLWSNPEVNDGTND